MKSPNFEHLKLTFPRYPSHRIFQTARQEWDFVAIEISDEWDSCPCGQGCYPIEELTI
jgi:hypothetical protein